MDLDFELKISPARDDDDVDDSSSTFELHLAKSTSPHFFWSDQTNSMFILTAKLTGFARDEIIININGSGTGIGIAWGQPVQRMEITRRTYKKETKIRGFKKIFRIPDGVALDEIKATYNDRESILKILMPKLVDGILGVGIEEVKEQEEVGEVAFKSGDCEAEEILEMNAEIETPSGSGIKTRMVHGNEEDEAVHEDFEEEEEKDEHETLPEMEHVAETPQEEIEKTKGDENEAFPKIEHVVETPTEEIEKTKGDENEALPKIEYVAGTRLEEIEKTKGDENVAFPMIEHVAETAPEEIEKTKGDENEALPKIEHVAETPLEEIEKTKGDENEAILKIEHVAETPPEEIEKMKSDENEALPKIENVAETSIEEIEKTKGEENEAFPKIEHVVETPPEEIEKTKGDENEAFPKIEHVAETPPKEIEKTKGGENEAFPKIEHVAETPSKEIEKTKGDEMKDIDGDSNDYSVSTQLEKVAIKTGENVSMEGIKVARGTDNHQKEKEERNAEAHDGNIATIISKKPDFKTGSQASTDREAQVLDRELSQPNRQTRAESGEQKTIDFIRESKEVETEDEPEDIESPYLKSPAQDNEGKGVDQKRKGFQTKGKTKEAREECKSPLKETHEDSSKEAKQEKNQDSKQFKIGTPILIAGSALLASIVIVVFNLVKSKRREKNMRD